MLTPDRSLAERLRRRCTSGGVVWADVQFDPIAGKLAIYLYDDRDGWGIYKHLYDDHGKPRQMTERDIDDAWQTGHGNGRSEELDAAKERNVARKKRDFEESRFRFKQSTEFGLRHQNSKTFSGGKQIGGRKDHDPEFGYCGHGRPHWDCWKCHEASLPTKFYMNSPSGTEKNGYIVIDKRRTS